MSDREGETDFSGSTGTSSFAENSRFGKSRGFTSNNDDKGDSFRSGGRGRGFVSSQNRDDRIDFGSKNNDNDRFKPTKSDDKDDDGGFKPTNYDDDDDGGFKPTNYDDDDSGGFKPTNYGDEDRGFKPSYNRDGDRRGRGRGRGQGGFNSNRNGGGDDDGGGFKPSYNRDGDRRGRGRGGYNSNRSGGGSNYGGNEDGDDGGFKPSYNRDGDRRGRGHGGFNRNDGGGGYGGDENEDNGGFRPRDGDRSGGRGRERGRGGGRNDGGFRRDGDDNFRGGRRDFGDGGGGGGRGGFGEDNGENREPINKEIYIPPEPEMDEDKIFDSGIGEGINFKDFDKIKVKVSENMPQPISSFEEAGLRQFVIDNLKKCGYKSPTPIQKYGLPIIMAKHDLMACAQTGSGKTAAFMVPIINTLLSEPYDLFCDGDHCEPQVLVLAPTRELVNQIADECRKYANCSILRIETAYGGTSVGYQKKRLLNGCHIIVGTAGRFTDYLDKGVVQLGSIRFLVLDEADRMLDMGFMKAVETVVDHETMVPKEQRSTLMFSATFPDEIQKIAGRFLKPDYAFVAVGIVGGANKDIEQNFYEVPKRQKKAKLVEILQREKENNSLAVTIIFVETKKTADFLAAYLSDNCYPTTSIHGDRMQSQREEALRDVKQQKMQILVATDVGARGLDIKGVVHVIQYDLSKDAEMYVHRIGRTGRVGNKGRATSFYDPERDGTLAGELVRVLKQAEQPVPDFLEGGDSGSSFQPGRSSNFGARDFRQTGKSDFDAGQTGGETEENW